MPVQSQVARRVALPTVIAIACLAFATPAFAGTDHFFNGGLSPSRSYASYSAHSAPYYVQAVTDHTACVTLSVGWAGYAPPGSGDLYSPAVQCYPSPHTSPGQPSGFWHGWVGNPNYATNVSVADSHYSW